MIKAVFFDIDGTLVSFKTHAVPQSTLDAIAELRKRNIKIFLASGRLITQTQVVDRIEFDGYITLNGCCCLAGDRRTIIHHDLIPQCDLETIVDYLEREGNPFPCSFMDDHHTTINFVDDRVREVWGAIDIPVPQVEDPRTTIKRDIYQANIYVDPDQDQHIIDTLFKHCESSRWHPMFADINRRGVSKRSGIDHLLEYYGIPLDQTMAFGDGGNDIQMLEHVHLGVAMGNAVDSAKQAADYVTDPVDDDGISNALYRLGVL